MSTPRYNVISGIYYSISMSSNLQHLEPNPDISAFYVRTTACCEGRVLCHYSFIVIYSMSVILVGRSLPEALAGLLTLLGTSFDLTVSTIISAAQQQLPLYQAIIIPYLVWISNIAVFWHVLRTHGAPIHQNSSNLYSSARHICLWHALSVFGPVHLALVLVFHRREY